MMQEIRLYKSVWQGLKLILLSSVFVIPGLYLIFHTEDGNSFVAWLAVCTFGIGYPVGLYLMLDRRPMIRINETGIMCRSLGDKFLNWELITGAYLAEVSGQRFISLEICEGFDPFPDKSPLYRQAAEINVAMGFQKINLPVSLVSVNPEKLLVLIVSLIHAERTERAEMLRLRVGGQS